MQDRNIQRAALLLLAACLLSITGCSTPAWFAGLRSGQLQACERMQDRDERERCRARAPQSYDAYQKELKRQSDPQ